MGTLYSELQKWLKSPLPSKNRPVSSEGIRESHWKEKPKVKLKEAEGGLKVAKTNQSNWGLAEHVDGKLRPDLVAWNGKLPLAIAGKEVPYLVGQYAIDVATMASISVQSLAYRTGHSPFLDPTALRFSPEQAYIDLGRLSPWDCWRVLWTRIGAHYFQDTHG